MARYLASPVSHSTTGTVGINQAAGLNQETQKNSEKTKQSPKEHAPLASVLLADTVIQPTQPPTPTVEDCKDDEHAPRPSSGLSYRATTNARGVLFSPTHQPVPFCPDTGTAISLISRKILRKYFPDIPVHRASATTNLSGIGQGPSTDEYVELPFHLVTTARESLPFIAEVHVIDYLSPGILLGTHFLSKHGLDVVWAKNKDQADALVYGSHYIRITIAKDSSPKTAPRRTHVYANTSVVIQPGTGINLPVRHRPVPYTTEGYLVSPQPQADIARELFGSLTRGIVDGVLYDGIAQPIPYANFGDAPIYIRKGQLLGVLEPSSAQPTPAGTVYLGLEEVFQGLPPVAQDDPEDYKAPDGHPYLIQPAEDDLDPDFSQADISSEWTDEQRQRIIQVLRDNAMLFRKELGSFNDEITMPIPFREGVDISDLKQAPYSLSPKDRAAIDKILDPLKEMGVVENVPLGKPCPAASPAFIVWKNGKPRLVVDLRRVNTKLYSDAYPLPKQDDIFDALGGSTVFSVLDMVKGFFQQKIAPEDRWKTSFVTPHRGHEQLTVSTMGLSTSPAFFQHRMEKLFGKYLWQFVLVYIDDVIIFSKTVDDHIRDLSIALRLLRDSGVTLSLPKCHFAQPSLAALGHHVSRLGLTTTADKLAAIRDLEFPTTLRHLEIGIGFFGYHRKFVDHYAAIERPLQVLKARGFKNAPRGKRQRHQHAPINRFLDQPLSDLADDTLLQECRSAWEQLKESLCTAAKLRFPDFEKKFKLYVDGSKERGFGAGLYQFLDDGTEYPILFLSRWITPAEEHYWPSELETAALVWALRKLPQYLDHGKFQVVTDHTAIRDAFKDIGRIRTKGSNRLLNWRLFLSKYLQQMEIVHRPGKLHVNADALSRLPAGSRPGQPETTTVSTRALFSQSTLGHFTRVHFISLQPKNAYTASFPVETRSASRRAEVQEPQEQEQEPAPPDVQESLPQESLPLEIPGSHGQEPALPAEIQTQGLEPVTVVSLHLHKDISDSIAKLLPSDRYFGKIYRKMRDRIRETAHEPEGPVTTLEQFRLDRRSKLLYLYDPIVGNDRLCIPFLLRQKIFEIAHDYRAHQGIHRTYNTLRTQIFIPKLKKALTEYIVACPRCRMAKPSRQLPWGDLKPVSTPDIPLSTLAFDFITGLPVSRTGYTACLTITCKTTKYVRLLLGMDTWAAEQWADAYFIHVWSDWGHPDVIISDRDPKFLSGFWTQLFERAKTRLAFTTAHHPSANSQAERTNQTAEHALLCIIGEKLDPQDWEDYIPYVQHAMNTSTNASTQATPYALLYGRDPKPLFLDATDEPIDFLEHRKRLRAEAMDAVKLAQAKMKLNYDTQHRKPQFNTGWAYLRLAKPGARGYHLQNQTKLSGKKIGPFRILELHPLSCKLELPDWMGRTHPVISMQHLEPAPADPYNRPSLPPGPLQIDGLDKYIIDKIIDHEQRTTPPAERGTWYKVKWLGYNDTTWEPKSNLMQDVPKLVRAYNRLHRLR